MNNRISKQIRDLDHSIRISVDNMYDLRKVLNFTQFQIIHYLFKHKGEEVCQKDLEAETHLTKASITSSIDDLVKKNIVKRVQSKTDKRKNYIELTDEARKIKNELDDNISKIESKLIKDINKKDLDVFFKVINKMNENIRG